MHRDICRPALSNAVFFLVFIDKVSFKHKIQILTLCEPRLGANEIMAAFSNR